VCDAEIVHDWDYVMPKYYHYPLPSDFSVPLYSD